MQAFSYEVYDKDGLFDSFVRTVADIFCKQFESYQLSMGNSCSYGAIRNSAFENAEDMGAHIAELITNRVHHDFSLLKRGRAAILEGFRESEALYGDYLPSISYRTLEAALGRVDGYVTHNVHS